ncbi:DUF998 domain-containing protein [Desulfosporosinus fructosivorans]
MLEGEDTLKFEYLNIKLIAMFSLIGLFFFMVIIIAMHILRPDYNPRSRYISEYAVGKYGQLAASSFVIYGLAILGIYLCLQTILSTRAHSNTGLAPMAIWGVCIAITGFFNVDLKDKQMSWHGTVHSIASVIGVAASVIGLILFSSIFALNESTQNVAFVTRIIAIVILILAMLLFLGILGDMALKYHHNVPAILLSFHNITGLIERSLIGFSVVWLIIIVNNLISVI